jgi:hypothetical protein
MIYTKTLYVFFRCSCGQCGLMAQISECRCCQEIEQVVERTSAASVPCITAHPGFASVCLDTHVLDTCYWWFQQQYRTTIIQDQNQ